MSVEANTVDFLLTVDARQAQKDIDRLQAQLMRVTQQIVRLTGQNELGNAMQLMQKAIVIAQALQLTYASMRVVATAGLDPIAWAQLGMAVTTTALTVYETGVWYNEVSSRSRGY